jgi:organic hydroperoxide reductase OsmC/OhrA
MTSGPGPSGTVTSHHAGVVWHGGKDDLRAHTVRAGGLEIAGSCSPQWGGDPAKVDPEDMFVASLSSCHMLWFLDLSRRERLRVTSYEDDAEGTMDGVRFTEVVLRPRVDFADEVDAATVERLHHDAHERCFLANSVSCPVVVRPA